MWGSAPARTLHPTPVCLPPQLLWLRPRSPNAASQEDGELLYAPHLRPQHSGPVGQSGGGNSGHWLPAERQLSGCRGQEEALSSQVSLFCFKSGHSRLTALLLRNTSHCHSWVMKYKYFGPGLYLSISFEKWEMQDKKFYSHSYISTQIYFLSKTYQQVFVWLEL